MDKQQMEAGLLQVLRTGPAGMIANRKGKYAHVQFQMTPEDFALFKTLQHALHVVHGRPVSGSLVVRTAIQALSETTLVALKDPRAAALMRARVRAVREKRGTEGPRA